MMRDRIDLKFFPGWTRKAITFTMDDGNVRLDEKFIKIIKQYGFGGTFNLSSADKAGYTHEDYRRIYSGYEIANHCKHHPQALPDSLDFVFSDEVFNADTAKNDGVTLYRDETIDGIWWLRSDTNVWGKIRYATADDYIRFVEEAERELEEVFGVGSVGAFVWPYTAQKKNRKVVEYIRNRGFYAVRSTGKLEDSTGFAMPSDRGDWIYNAGWRNLLQVAKLFDEYPDDGELKLFAFGIHSHDYENNNTWGDMELFAKTYGNRPEDFYYASNREIFEYEDAVNAIIVENDKITNPTDIRLYIKIDGERIILDSNSSIQI